MSKRAPETPITQKALAAVLAARLAGHAVSHIVVKLNSKAHKALARGRRVGVISSSIRPSTKISGAHLVVFPVGERCAHWIRL